VLVGADLRGASLLQSEAVVSDEGSPEQSADEHLSRRASFNGATLDRAILTGVDLRGVDLAAASLRRANFAGARLAHVNLARADLGFADLTKADLAGATLTKADLRHARVCALNLDGPLSTGRSSAPRRGGRPTSTPSGPVRSKRTGPPSRSAA
jgi:uncharacterized protein YjbI with pentapeptide repeats